MDRLLVHDGVQAHGVQAQIRDVPVVAIRWLRREEPIFKILRGGISRNWRTNHGLHRDLAGHNGDLAPNHGTATTSGVKRRRSRDGSGHGGRWVATPSPSGLTSRRSRWGAGCGRRVAAGFEIAGQVVAKAPDHSSISATNKSPGRSAGS